MGAEFACSLAVAGRNIVGGCGWEDNHRLTTTLLLIAPSARETTFLSALSVFNDVTRSIPNARVTNTHFNVADHRHRAALCEVIRMG